jgi:hypothetical protein
LLPGDTIPTTLPSLTSGPPAGVPGPMPAVVPGRGIPQSIAAGSVSASVYGLELPVVARMLAITMTLP